MAPAFIVCPMRSGSTLLALILDAHSQLAVARETAIGRTAAGLCSGAWPRATDWYGFPDRWWELCGEDRAGFLRRVASFYEGLLGDYAAARGKVCWVEKSPVNAHHVGLLAELWPRARFIHLVRHPLGVCASLRELRYSLDEAVEYWRETHAALLAWEPALGADRYFRIHYEELVAHPESELRRLTGFLRIPWEPDLLRHHERAYGGLRSVEGGERNRPDRPIDARSLERWQELLIPHEVRSCLRRTEEIRRRLGCADLAGCPRGGRQRPRHSPRQWLRIRVLRLLAEHLDWRPWRSPDAYPPSGPAF